MFLFDEIGVFLHSSLIDTDNTQISSNSHQNEASDALVDDFNSQKDFYDEIFDKEKGTKNYDITNPVMAWRYGYQSKLHDILSMNEFVEIEKTNSISNSPHIYHDPRISEKLKHR